MAQKVVIVPNRVFGAYNKVLQPLERFGDKVLSERGTDNLRFRDLLVVPDRSASGAAMEGYETVDLVRFLDLVVPYLEREVTDEPKA